MNLFLDIDSIFSCFDAHTGHCFKFVCIGSASCMQNLCFCMLGNVENLQGESCLIGCSNFPAPPLVCYSYSLSISHVNSGVESQLQPLESLGILTLKSHYFFSGSWFTWSFILCLLDFPRLPWFPACIKLVTIESLFQIEYIYSPFVLSTARVLCLDFVHLADAGASYCNTSNKKYLVCPLGEY